MPSRTEKKAETETLTARVPQALARRIRLEAAARQQSVSEYLHGILDDRLSEAARPAVAALGELIEMAAHVRLSHPRDGVIAARLERLIAIISTAASGEVHRDL